MKAENLTSCCCKTMPYEGRRAASALMWNMLSCSHFATSALSLLADIKMIIYSAAECVGTDRRAECVCAVGMGGGAFINDTVNIISEPQ